VSFQGRSLENYFVFDGQSLNNLPGSPNNYVSLIVAEFPLARRNNISINGASWTNLRARRATIRDPLLKVGKNTVLSLLGGTSDIWDADDEDAVYADMVDAAESARLVNPDVKVIAHTISPSITFTAPEEAVRVAANILILADAESAFDAAVDLDVGGLTNPDAPWTGSSCYSDGTHWSVNGSELARDTALPYWQALVA
jgi:hypothetical protein